MNTEELTPEIFKTIFVFSFEELSNSKTASPFSLFSSPTKGGHLTQFLFYKVEILLLYFIKLKFLEILLLHDYIRYDNDTYLLFSVTLKNDNNRISSEGD